MATRRGRGGGGSKAKEQADATPPPEVSSDVVDLNSRSATYIASIVFYPVQQHNLSIIQFEVRDCLQVCQHFRHWLQITGSPEVREVVRIDSIEHELIAPNTKGNIFFLEGAATLEGEPSAPVSIFALQIPKDKHVRYLWTPLSPSILLSDLAIRGLIGPPITCANQFKPTRSPTGAAIPPYHHTLYTIIVQCFEDATKYPDSPEYCTASRISDVCPSILDPATALQRIHAEDDLYISNDPSVNGRDLGDDRYILELHPAERELASLVYVGCAKYLLIKRQYFKAFSRETVLHAAKVRRAAAYQRNINRATGPSSTEHVDVDGHQADEEIGDDGDKEDNDPLAATPVPRATPPITRSRARTKQAANQQTIDQGTPDDTQNDESSAADNPKPKATPLNTRSRTRLQRATDQQNVTAGTEQEDITMEEQDENDGKQEDEPPADTPNLRVTRSGGSTRRSTADLPATYDVKSAIPLAGTGKAKARRGIKAKRGVKAKREDKANEKVEEATDDVKQSNETPAKPRKSKARPSSTRPRARRTRQSVANEPATNIENEEEEVENAKDEVKQSEDTPAESPRAKAKASSASPRAHRMIQSAADVPANTIETENEEDVAEDPKQTQAIPTPTTSQKNPTNTPTAPSTTRSGARRTRLPAAEIAASRLNASFAAARNRALRVRTKNKHIRTLEEQVGFAYRRAHKLVLGWEILGFLDEKRVLAVQEGEDDEGKGEWSE